MALDIDLAGIDEDLVRRGVHPEVIAALAGAQPAAKPAPSALSFAQPQPQPGSRDYNLRVGATSQPNAPSFTGPRAEPTAPDVQATPPTGNALSFVKNGQPAQPASIGNPTPNGNPADPMNKGAQPVSFAKRYEQEAANAPNPADYRLKPGEGPQGWKKWLDIAGQIAAPRIEALIPGSRGNIQEKKAQAYSDAQTTHQQRAGAIEKQSSIQKQDDAEQFDTPEKRQAYVEQNPTLFDGVTDFQKNDFILSGKFPQRDTPEQKQPTNTFELWRQQNPNAPAADWLKLEQSVKPAPADANKLAGEIEAQVGVKPTTAQWRGKNYPSVEAAQSAWGSAAEAIKNREAAAGRSVYTGAKSTNFIMPDGSLRTVDGLDVAQFLKDNPQAVMTGSGTPERAMSKEAQFKEIHSGIDNLRQAITKLDKPFTPEQIGKLTLAMKHSSDPSVFRKELETLLGTQQLTGPQEDLVIWLGHLNERALSIRSIAGMGQGSDSMRAAIQGILPSIKSGSTQMMNKQLAAFENQVNKLEVGVPKMPGSQGGASAPAPKDFGAAPAGKAENSTGTLPDGTKIVVRGGRIVAQ